MARLTYLGHRLPVPSFSVVSAARDTEGHNMAQDGTTPVDMLGYVPSGYVNIAIENDH